MFQGTPLRLYGSWGDGECSRGLLCCMYVLEGDQEYLRRETGLLDLYRVYLASYPFFCYLCLRLTLDFTSYGEAKDRIQSRLS